MIKASERKQDIVKWHFPTDTESPTIWHIKRQVGAQMVYLQALRMQESQEYTFEEWLNDTLIANIQKIENWENEDGEVVTLASPVDVEHAIKMLTRNEIYVLMAAVSREGKIFDMGVMEKNSEQPLESVPAAKPAKPTKEKDA